MRQVLIVAIWAGLVGVIGFAVFSPGRGVMWQGPGGTVGVGLIGLSLCLEARRRGIAAQH